MNAVDLPNGTGVEVVSQLTVDALVELDKLQLISVYESQGVKYNIYYSKKTARLYATEGSA